MTYRAILVLACFAVPALAGAQTAQGTDSPTGSAPDAARRATRDAIPITPEMIRDLARRLGENQQTEEEANPQIASPVSRAVKVTYAPGQASSIVQKVR